MPAISLSGVHQDASAQNADFKSYLENSLRNPFTVDLKNCTLVEVILACTKVKSKRHPNYRKNVACLLHNIRALESEYRVTIYPIQVTDIFWGHFIAFCQNRGLKCSSIGTMCNQLKAVLSWATKYNVTVASTYADVDPPKSANQEIALAADDVSRITYFDIDLFYADRRKDFREKMKAVRDMFVLSVCLYQRHSDMLRISPECFDRNIFHITQQKTGSVAVVNIDKYSVNPKAAYRILEKYNYTAPYKADIGNYNDKLHELMRDIGFNEQVRVEERVDGKLVTTTVPKWKMITSHTARRTAITIGVLRGHNVHSLRKCSGHNDLRIFDGYVRDE